MTAATDPQLSVIFKRPFAEQVAFFRGKLGNLMPTATWRDLSKAQNERGFMVAGASKADLLADLAGAVDKANAEGASLKSFQARFGEIVQRNGWHGWTGEETKAGQAWRTQIIYETNLTTSYAAGRHAQLMDGDYPYWMWKHSGLSKEPRPEHLKWDGLVLPVEHEFWKRHFPPYDNGSMAWGCKCRVLGVRSPEQARRLGGTPDKELPKGWNAGELIADSRPSESALDTIRALTPKLDQLPPQPSIALIQDWLRTETFARWFENPQGDWPLVRLGDEQVAALDARTHIATLASETAAKQKQEHPELTPREYVEAQRVVNDATDWVVQENVDSRGKKTGTKSVVYVLDESSEQAGGYVLVVKATATGRGVWITSYRRLSRDQALREEEIRRIIEGKKRQ